MGVLDGSYREKWLATEGSLAHRSPSVEWNVLATREAQLIDGFCVAF